LLSHFAINPTTVMRNTIAPMGMTIARNNVGFAAKSSIPTSQNRERKLIERMHQNDSVVAVGDFLAHERVSLELGMGNGPIGSGEHCREPSRDPNWNQERQQ
jgi:hypothetical protein